MMGLGRMGKAAIFQLLNLPTPSPVTLSCLARRLPPLSLQVGANKLSGEVPTWLMQRQLSCYQDNSCQQVAVDLEGNELWCPLASSLKGEWVTTLWCPV
jgi:hypothetical protein